jgi:hypothetical protein
LGADFVTPNRPLPRRLSDQHSHDFGREFERGSGMETTAVAFDRSEARALFREYRKHLHWSAPIDHEIRRTYQFIAQGRVVIRALESVKAAGLNTEGEGVGFPRLALTRADATTCVCTMGWRGSCTMTPDDTRSRTRWRDGAQLNWRNVMSWPDGTFTINRNVRSSRAQAFVPTPPLHLRPKRGLANYHVLFEAEWTKGPPDDPMLLRRIGRGDLWLVVASWNLTAVEKAALATRL